MQLIYYTCVVIAVICVAPFALMFMAAPFIMLCHGVYSFAKTHDSEDFWEAWFGLGLLAIMIAGVCAWLMDK